MAQVQFRHPWKQVTYTQHMYYGDFEVVDGIVTLDSDHESFELIADFLTRKLYERVVDEPADEVAEVEDASPEATQDDVAPEAQAEGEAASDVVTEDEESPIDVTVAEDDIESYIATLSDEDQQAVAELVAEAAPEPVQAKRSRKKAAAS